MHRVLATACAALVAAASFAAQDAPPDQHQRMHAMVQARHIAMAVAMYGAQHAGLPPDLKTLAEQGILPAHGELDQENAAWIADGVAYRYLGMAGVAPDEVPDWSNVAIAHQGLDAPFLTQPTPGNPEGALVAVAFLDGHVEMVSLAEAQWLIEDAMVTFAALAGKGPMPLDHRVELDAGRLARAMIAYAEAHDGIAPAKWSDTYAFLSDDSRHADETQADRLRLFLSPRARDTTFIPPFDDQAELDEWINVNSMWRTPTAGIDLRRVPLPASTLLVYAQTDAWVEAPDRRRREHVRRLACATVDGRPRLVDREILTERARTCSAVFEAIREGASLPPLHDAVHDLNVLSRAILAYARDNDGLLPPDLGEVLPYLDGLWGVHEQQPARVFLTRNHESRHSLDRGVDADWVREHATYVYLGDEQVRLPDLRAGVGVLLHAPLDEPFAWTPDHPAAEPIDVIPYAPPLHRPWNSTALGASHAHVLPAASVAHMATDARQAILRAAGDQ